MIIKAKVYSKMGLGSLALEVEVLSFREASEKYREFTDKHNLGSSQCEDGKVFRNGKQIARVSYNGKVWKELEYIPGRTPVYNPYK